MIRRGAKDLGLALEWHYEFVPPGTQLRVRKDTVLLDVGGGLGPGALDHHGAHTPDTSTVQLVSRYPEYVYEHLLGPWLRRQDDGQDLQGRRWSPLITTHKAPDLDACSAALLVRKLLEDGELPDWASSLEQFVTEVDQGRWNPSPDGEGVTNCVAMALYVIDEKTLGYPPTDEQRMKLAQRLLEVEGEALSRSHSRPLKPADWYGPSAGSWQQSSDVAAQLAAALNKDVELYRSDCAAGRIHYFLGMLPERGRESALEENSWVKSPYNSCLHHITQLGVGSPADSSVIPKGVTFAALQPVDSQGIATIRVKLPALAEIPVLAEIPAVSPSAPDNRVHLSVFWWGYPGFGNLGKPASEILEVDYAVLDGHELPAHWDWSARNSDNVPLPCGHYVGFIHRGDGLGTLGSWVRQELQRQRAHRLFELDVPYCSVEKALKTLAEMYAQEPVVPVKAAVLLEPPECRLLKYWLRGAGVPFLLVPGDASEKQLSLLERSADGWLGPAACPGEDTSRNARWIISLDPTYRDDLGRFPSLKGLGLALENLESRGRDALGGDARTGPPRWDDGSVGHEDPWYDGRGHKFTIVDAPNSGTALASMTVLRLALNPRDWFHYRETQPLRIELRVLVGMLDLKPQRRALDYLLPSFWLHALRDRWYQLDSKQRIFHWQEAAGLSRLEGDSAGVRRVETEPDFQSWAPQHLFGVRDGLVLELEPYVSAAPNGAILRLKRFADQRFAIGDRGGAPPPEVHQIQWGLPELSLIAVDSEFVGERALIDLKKALDEWGQKFSRCYPFIRISPVDRVAGVIKGEQLSSEQMTYVRDYVFGGEEPTGFMDGTVWASDNKVLIFDEEPIAKQPAFFVQLYKALVIEHSNWLLRKLSRPKLDIMSVFRQATTHLLEYDREQVTLNLELQRLADQFDGEAGLPEKREKLRTDGRSLSDVLEQRQNKMMNLILFGLGMLGLVDAVNGIYSLNEVAAQGHRGWLHTTVGLVTAGICFSTFLFRRR